MAKLLCTDAAAYWLIHTKELLFHPWISLLVFFIIYSLKFMRISSSRHVVAANNILTSFSSRSFKKILSLNLLLWIFFCPTWQEKCYCIIIINFLAIVNAFIRYIVSGDPIIYCRLITSLHLFCSSRHIQQLLIDKVLLVLLKSTK